MSKKSIALVAKKSTKKSAAAKPKAERAERVSNIAYRWVKPLSEPPAEETTYGVIYNTLRKVKKGTLAEITDAAIDNGLRDYSDQDPTRMCRVHLRYIVNGGAADQTRGGEAVAPKAKAKGKGKTSAKDVKKTFKLKK